MKKIVLIVFSICTSLLASSQTSFPTLDKGLSFQTEDGSSLVKMSFRAQSLFTYDNNFDGSNEDIRAMVRRMRLKFGGHLHDPKFEYKLEIGFSNRDIGNRRDELQVNNASKMVLDAVLKYHVAKGHTIWFGQTKLPGNRERVISSQALQFVDRSLVNSRFNIDRDFGVQYHIKKEIASIPVRIAAAISTGEGRNITASNVGGLCYTGRLEFYPFGNFAKKGDYFGSDLAREEKPKLAIGTTYSVNKQTNRTGGQLGSFQTMTDSLGNVNPLTADLNTFFIDLMFKYEGWSIMSEYANRTVSNEDYAFIIGNGIVGQIGYLFDNNFEIAARLTNVQAGTKSSNLTNTNEYTLCLSKYIVGHKVKWQTDISLFNSDTYRFRFQLEFGI